MDVVRKEAEGCDALQGFQITHSLGFVFCFTVFLSLSRLSLDFLLKRIKG